MIRFSTIQYYAVDQIKIGVEDPDGPFTGRPSLFPSTVMSTLVVYYSTASSYLTCNVL